MVAELLGWFGAGLSCVISLPQVVRTVRAKQLEGISSATYWLVLANAAAWTAWSLLTGEYAAGFPALVNGPVAVVILHRLAVTRHDTPDPEVQQCVQRSDVPPNPGVEHVDPGLLSLDPRADLIAGMLMILTLRVGAEACSLCRSARLFHNVSSVAPSRLGG